MQEFVPLVGRDQDRFEESVAKPDFQAVQRQGGRAERVTGWGDLSDRRQGDSLAAEPESNGEITVTDPVTHRKNDAGVDDQDP